MSKKSASQKRAQRQQEERAALNNIFIAFLVGLISEGYLFLTYQFFTSKAPNSIDTMLLWVNVLEVLTWVGLGICALGAGLAIWKRKADKLRRIGICAAVVGLFLSVSSWVMVNFFTSGVLTMCAVVAIMTILALIFFLYQRDCFLNTVLLSGTLFTLWVCNRGLDSNWKSMIVIGACFAAALLAGVAVLSRVLQVRGGKLGKIRLLSADTDYRMIYIICAVSVLLIALALILPGYIYYLIWAAVIALFAELAYYTTKLM